MQASKEQIQINGKGDSEHIQIEQTEKKVDLKEQPPQKVQQNSIQNANLIKLYIYGSCESDQFRHPKKLSQSKRPICLTDIQKFDLNEEEDSDNEEEKAKNFIPNPLFKKSVYKIACGGLHSVVLTTDGKAYTFGCNDEGALGRKGPQCVPLQVELDSPVDLVSAGDNHTMFANSVNGIVYFTGNYNYLRGQKMVESVKQPVKFTTKSLDIRNKNHPIEKLVSGANHTCILVNKRIFCRGQPQSFTTGRRINERRKTQNSLTFDGVGLNQVLDVWCGGYHSVAKVKKGKNFIYYTWGKNDQGQLGIGNFESQSFPVQIKSLRGKNIKKIAAGGFFTLFLTEEGEILGCGTNEYGQLGLGQDYQFVPSQTESQEEESQQKSQVEKPSEQLQSQQKVQASHQNKPELNQQSEINRQKRQKKLQNQKDKKVNEMQAQKVQIKPQSGKMISQSQQKVFNNPIPNTQPVIQPSIPLAYTSANFAFAQPNTAFQNQEKKKFQQKNTYIKSIRPLSFPEEITPKTPIMNIAAGSQFSFAWNNLTQLYSWGFGMNYVLLNGEQNQQYEPFKVRTKIYNDEIIDELQAGGQHVLYTAYEKTESKKKPQIELAQAVKALHVSEKGKLSRKRKV